MPHHDLKSSDDVIPSFSCDDEEIADTEDEEIADTEDEEVTDVEDEEVTDAEDEEVTDAEDEEVNQTRQPPPWCRHRPCSLPAPRSPCRAPVSVPANAVYGMWYDLENAARVLDAYFGANKQKQEYYMKDIRKRVRDTNTWSWNDLGINTEAHEALNLDIMMRGEYDDAALKIQKRFRRAISDPKKLLCIKRLQLEFNEMSSMDS